MRLRKSRRGRRPLRVFSIPGKTSTTRFVPLFCKGLEDGGLEVLDFRDLRIWTLAFDIVHLHFPVHYIAERSLAYSLVRSALSLTFYLAAKGLGRATFVYTVHDVMPFRPRSEWLLRPLLGLVHRLVDGYVFLSDSSHHEFIGQFPREATKPWLRIDHGAFPVTVTGSASRRSRHAALLGLDTGGLLIGYLGVIKDYKGLEFLSSLPPKLADGTKVRLVIAGTVDPTYKATADAILNQLGSAPTRIDKRLSDAELEELIQVVDVVMLPYTRGWNSGMAMLVLSAHTRILATRRPLFLELQEQVGAPWIYTFDGDPASCVRSLTQALQAIRDDPITAEDKARLGCFLAERGFARAGHTLRAFYNRLSGAGSA